jgi:hypothetical protein
MALALKHSCVLLAPVFLALAVVDPLVSSPSSRPRLAQLFRNLGAIACAGLISIGVLWTAYGPRYAGRPNAAPIWENERVNESKSLVATRLIPVLEKGHLLPEAYLKGFQDILVDPEVIPRPVFLNGHVYRGGRWYYFPLAALIKFSAIVLGFSVAACFAFRFWRERRRELLFLLIPSAFFMAASCASDLNMGIRHILPLLPFLFLFGAAGTCALLASHRRGWFICAALVVLHGASSLHAFPNYLSYSNEFWGGPGNTYKYLADSNVDWGQSMKEAKAYLDRTQPQSCWVIHAYNDSNADYGIPCGETAEYKMDEPPQHLNGTLIITASALAGVLNYTGGSRTADMFRDLQPTAKLGGSALFVYRGDFDLSIPLASYHAQQSTRLLPYNTRAALIEAEQAAAYDPRNHIAHFVICLAAETMGDGARAERECNVTLKIIRDDPNVLADRPGIERYMKVRGMRVNRQ